MFRAQCGTHKAGFWGPIYHFLAEWPRASYLTSPWLFFFSSCSMWSFFQIHLSFFPCNFFPYVSPPSSVYCFSRNLFHSLLLIILFSQVRGGAHLPNYNICSPALMTNYFPTYSRIHQGWLLLGKFLWLYFWKCSSKCCCICSYQTSLTIIGPEPTH